MMSPGVLSDHFTSPVFLSKQIKLGAGAESFGSFRFSDALEPYALC